jgi:hypothetical protein
MFSWGPVRSMRAAGAARLWIGVMLPESEGWRQDAPNVSGETVKRPGEEPPAASGDRESEV